MSRPGWIAALALVFAFVAAPVFAQGGSSSATLNGVVKDKDGTVIGAAGASGGTGEEDEAVCMAGITAAGLAFG